MTTIESIRKYLMNASIEGGKILSRPFYKNKNWRYTHDSLYTLPNGSTGRELVKYLDSMDFKLVEGYEPHDVKHIITGYEMDTIGEVRLQFYLFGNGNQTLPVLFTLAFGISLIPEHILTFWEDYKEGKKAKSLFYLDYSALLEDNLIKVRHTLGIHQLPAVSKSLFRRSSRFLETIFTYKAVAKSL